MPANDIAPVPCPDCGGKMWDNRSTRKGNQPDYRCKNRNGCGKGIWLTDTERNAAQGNAPAAAPGAPAAPGGVILDAMMFRCLQSAHAMLSDDVAKGKLQSYTSDNVINVATSLFIARTRDRSGILKIEKPKPVEKKPEPPPPPPPPPKPEPPAPDPRGPGYYDSPGVDDDLPF